MARKVIFAILLILKLAGVYSLHITETAESNYRRKRNIITLFPVNEEYAPEDMLKNSMDKVSERVKRSIERDGGTYGMRLTGGKGVVYNDTKYPNQYTLKDRINDSENNRIKTFQDDFETCVKQDLSTENFDIKELSTVEPRKEKLQLNTDHDLYGDAMFHNVGKPQNKVVKKASNDDETINKQIQSFRNSLRETTFRGNLKYRRPNLTTITEIPINQKLSIVKPITKTPTNRKPIAKRPSTKKPIAVQPITKAPSISKTSIAEPNIEKLEGGLDTSTTYGMSLKKGQGIVWNDLNQSRVSYHVGGEISAILETSEGDKIPNVKNKVEQSKEKSRSDLNIDVPVTNEPQIDPFAGEPAIHKDVIEEPKTNRPIFFANTVEKTTNKPMIDATSIVKDDEEVKTYGMILTGDRGTVWNDLNGYRVSIHVGIPDDDKKENDLHSQSPENDMDDILAKPIDIDNKNSEDDLINDVNDVFNETNNILTEAPEKMCKCVNSTSNIIDNTIIDIVKETLINETNNLKNELKDWIKQEVPRQIEEYFATHSEVKPIKKSNDNKTKIVEQKEENLDETQPKKRKNCEEKQEKDPSSKIIANNIYGNTIGNGNVTNIFIFNINNGSDISRTAEEANNNAEKPIENSEQPTENAEQPNGNAGEPNKNPEVPIENAEEPNENAEEPNENKVQPNNNTEEPEEPKQNAEEPFENAEEPNQNAEKPIENSEEPNENVKEPNVNAEKPNDNTVEPNGISEEQIENNEEPNENAEEPNRDAESPNENAEEPNENAEELNDNMEEPNGNLEEPIENIKEPNANAQEPNENTELNENVESTSENSEEPNEKMEEPIENAEVPIENAEDPNENSEGSNQNVEEPNENSEVPNENVEEPNEPNENSEVPNENVEEPNEHADELNENEGEPNGNADEPNKNVDKSKENSAEQAENVEEPDGNAEEPNEDAEQPNENAEEPNEIAEEPYENAEEANENSELGDNAIYIDPQTTFEKYFNRQF